MKARYFYLNDLKEKAHIYATNGSKDNPFIYFPENLKAQFFFKKERLIVPMFIQKLHLIIYLEINLILTYI